MKKPIAITILLLAIFSLRVSAQSEFGFAFYDADCLYDTLPSPFYNDSDYTPDGRRGWNTERYNRRTAQVAALLDSMAMPVVALGGVENEQVVRDIVAQCGCDYSYVHRTSDSFDGLDFALLYFGDLLVPQRVTSSRRHLAVEAKIGDAEYVFIICRKARNLVETVREVRSRKGSGIHIIAAGDLRDTEFVKAGLRDVTEGPERAGRGNVLYGNSWRMFDRIAVDDGLGAECDVYARRYMLDSEGAPAAVFEGWRYKGGTGRRLPVAGRFFRQR